MHLPDVCRPYAAPCGIGPKRPSGMRTLLYFLVVCHAENAIKKNINLLLESISLDDDKSLVSACIVLFIIAFFQEGKLPS